jgi:hypothetical protein
MATTPEAELDNKVQIIRNSFTQYQGILIDIQANLDFPKKGILFFDCLPIFENPRLFNMLVSLTQPLLMTARRI